MQEFGTFMFHTLVRWYKLGEVENEFTLHDSSSWPSLCQKLSNLVNIWQSCGENNF